MDVNGLHRRICVCVLVTSWPLWWCVRLPWSLRAWSYWPGSCGGTTVRPFVISLSFDGLRFAATRMQRENLINNWCMWLKCPLYSFVGKDPLREVEGMKFSVSSRDTEALFLMLFRIFFSDFNSRFSVCLLQGCSRDASDFQNAAVIFLNKDSQEVHMY